MVQDGLYQFYQIEIISMVHLSIHLMISICQYGVPALREMD